MKVKQALLHDFNEDIGDVFIQNNVGVKKPLIKDDGHVDYLYENYCPERLVDKQIEAKLKEENEEFEKNLKKHKQYAKNNYIKVGEC